MGLFYIYVGFHNLKQDLSNQHCYLSVFRQSIFVRPNVTTAAASQGA